MYVPYCFYCQELIMVRIKSPNSLWRLGKLTCFSGTDYQGWAGLTALHTLSSQDCSLHSPHKPCNRNSTWHPSSRHRLHQVNNLSQLRAGDGILWTLLGWFPLSFHPFQIVKTSRGDAWWLKILLPWEVSIELGAFTKYTLHLNKLVPVYCRLYIKQFHI